MSSIALIPARSGSQRVRHKNIYNLSGHPMIAYTIDLAIKTKLFEKIVVVTDSPKYAQIAIKYGAEVPALRPKKISGSLSPDIHWVEWILELYKKRKENYNIFSILRPTSPFRKIESVKKAMSIFLKSKMDSLRAMEPTPLHPGKMWRIVNNIAYPLMPFEINGVFWHSNQTKTLPTTYVQNASLEISYSSFVFKNKSITGNTIIPFFFEEYECLDINTFKDLEFAEYLLSKKKIFLPKLISK